MFSGLRIIDYGSHYMLGRVKGRWAVVNSSKKPPKVRQDVEALKEMPIPCCMCEPVVTAQSLGDETHAVVTRPRWAREHGQHTC